ncbi:hypothetical protein [Flavobacterium urocaniciphilum]|nr:hypothetical protein [Flavobacterium urocaniciphilum]
MKPEAGSTDFTGTNFTTLLVLTYFTIQQFSRYIDSNGGKNIEY